MDNLLMFAAAILQGVMGFAVLALALAAVYRVVVAVVAAIKG